MKTTVCALLLASSAVLLSVSFAKGQGTFRNLDFENPIPPLPSEPSISVPISNAIPGWTAYIGSFQPNTIVYNTVGIGSAVISLHNSTSTFPPIQGNYSVLFQATETTSVGVGQTGQIPASAKTLLFYGSTRMQVTFAGQLLPLANLGAISNYDILGANISAFAGQTGELKFIMPAYPLRGQSYLDNIQFSTQVIPEPSTIGLSVLGAFLLGWLSRKRRRA